MSGNSGLIAASRELEPASECCAPDVPTSALKAKEVIIQELDYGYIVEVGCQKFAIESIDKLIENLTAYLKNPLETEKKWFKDKKLS